MLFCHWSWWGYLHHGSWQTMLHFPPESWLHVTRGVRVSGKGVCQTLQLTLGKSRVVGGLSWDLLQVGLLGRSHRLGEAGGWAASGRK